MAPSIADITIYIQPIDVDFSVIINLTTQTKANYSFNI